MRNFFSKSSPEKPEDVEYDKLPPLSRYEDEEDFFSPSQSQELLKKSETEQKSLKEKIAQVQNINELYELLADKSVQSMPSYFQAASQIERLNNYYRVNATSVIVGEMVSEKMAEKDEPAQEFARMFQSINDPYEFGLKDKVKELLKAEMKNDFENDSLNYAKKGIERSKTIEQLKRVVGYFNRLKAKDLNSETPHFYTGQEVNSGIDNALDYLNRLIEFQDLASQDENYISGEINSALLSVPDDDFGIKEKCQKLLYEYVLSKKTNKTPKTSLWGRLANRFFNRKEAA